MIKNLKKQREIVALEAGATEYIADFMKAGFNRVYDDIRGFLVNFAPPSKLHVFTRENKDFLTIIDQHRFDELMDLPAYVPEGLSVDYLTYIDVLEQAAIKLQGLIPNTLQTYANFLGSIINFEDTAKNTWIQFEGALRLEETEHERLVKLFGKCFTKHSNETKVTIDKVVRRNADWVLVFKAIESVNQKLHAIDRTIIAKTVEQCVVNLDIIKRNIQAGKYKNASHETVKTLADMAYSVANELEFYAIVFYKIEAINKSITDTCKGVVEIYKH